MSARSTSAETIRGLGALLAALLAAPAVSAESHGYSSEVVGEAEPPKSASVHRLRKEEILLLPRRNAEDLLRSTPGLSLVQHGSEGKGHQFFLRGFDAGHGSDFEINSTSSGRHTSPASDFRAPSGKTRYDPEAGASSMPRIPWGGEAPIARSRPSAGSEGATRPSSAPSSTGASAPWR